MSPFACGANKSGVEWMRNHYPSYAAHAIKLSKLVFPCPTLRLLCSVHGYDNPLVTQICYMTLVRCPLTPSEGEEIRSATVPPYRQLESLWGMNDIDRRTSLKTHPKHLIPRSIFETYLFEGMSDREK